MRKSSATVFFAALSISLLLYISVSNTPTPRFNFSDSAVSKVWSNYTAWHDCLMQNISKLHDDPNALWGNLWRGLKKCETIDEMKGLFIGDYPNSDETKRHIVPKMELPSVIITLGIGHDTGAEEKLKKGLKHGSEFFGADPMHEINEDLFTKLGGKYFPFAVGATPGLAEASVLINSTYTTKTVVNVDIIYFLKKLVNRTFIDDIWIDGEGAEYGLFDHFYNGGAFDQNGITFCQFNIEIHLPDNLQKKLFHDFIFQLLKDKRYAIYRPVQGSHMRLFMLNYANEECVYKYIL
ncbi:Methyltransferase FkbM domain-containing protein [Caenorhabditis elegans]|uniref:Methyltransferase FkbM domain-containing protein n=1 Tax=Caenorhabditis elegans TaxID=6239 RepID=Q21881_CAEEL|nr:Methyltransferase FkbM domain-containing protein [Caenorhabditis elegans]CAB00871.1 Methyltransferase FkbM domain-containing protein [Caenorhabditis elegans]|eukprot:NP_501961.1 Uncharacterized protein CELE_R09H10.2 [Caenorhabditis elegans]